MDNVVARSLPARGRWAVALILLILVTVATTPPVEAQCTLASSPFPASLAGAGNLGNFNVAGFASQLYISNNGTRMSLLGNYGAVAFDTTNPGAPRATGYLNIINVLGPIPGDGQSYPDAFYVSPDGARVLFNINKVNSDNLIGLMSAAGGFDIQGAFGPPALRGEVVQQIQQGATRYVAYLLTSNGLGVLDMTTLSGSSQRAGEMSTETTPFPAGSLIQLAPPYVAYIDANGKVTVIDVSNPGPKGSIASGLHSYALDGTAWGHPAPDQPVTIAIATDPADQSALPKLFLFGEFLNTTTGVYSYSLAQFTPALGASPVGGSFTPPSPYVTGLRSATASPNGTELGLFWWVKAPVRVTGLQYDQLRLYSSSLTDWRVSNPPQSIDINPASFSGNFPTVWDTKVIRATETSAFAYTATGYAAMVIPMTCLAANSPAVASLTVQRDPCPTDGVTPCQLDPTKNIIDVYLGETLKITPQIVPLPTPQRPLLDWRFDFDFHEGGADDFGVAGQYPRLKLPDKSDPSGNPPPASFRLIGPCDPNVSGTAPDTGSGCWNSVKNNGPFAFGVPDYTGEPPFNSSAQTTLTLAFEAKNGLGSNGLFKFPIRWNVPKVRLKSNSILSSHTVDDGSDGTPLATGYKWYFGSTPGTPLTDTLTQDPGCGGPKCQHSFTAGNGAYWVWVSVPYANGYTTADCNPSGNTCTVTAGALSGVLAGVPPLVLTVSDVVPSFTINGAQRAPSTASVTNFTLSVLNGTQVAGTITGVTYQYCLYKQGAAPCFPPSTPITFNASGLASITWPGVTAGRWYIRFRVSYSGGSTADWTPTVSGAPTPLDWPIDVTSVPPTLQISGLSITPFGLLATTGTSLTAAVYRGSSLAEVPAAMSWNFGARSSPATAGPGQNVQFTYTAPGTSTVTVTGYEVTLTVDITSVDPTPLSVSISASNYSPAINASVTFTASATGGQGPYSYSWSFPPLLTGPYPGQSVTKSFSAALAVSAICTVTDSRGVTATSSVPIGVTGGGPAGGGGGGGGGGADPCAGFGFSVINADPPYTSYGNSLQGFGSEIPFGVNIGFNSMTSSSGLLWDFGDSTTSTVASPTHLYANAGTYTVRLTGGGCSSSLQITVDAPAFPLDISIADDATGQTLIRSGNSWSGAVSGERLRFLALNPQTQAVMATASWTFGDGTTSSTNPAIKSFSTTTDVTYTVTVLASGQPKSCTLAVHGVLISGNYTFEYVDGSPLQVTSVTYNKPIRFTATDTGADIYAWDFGDGTIGAGAVVDHSFRVAGTFVVKLTVTKSSQAVTTPAPTSFSVLSVPQWVVPGLAYVNQGLLPGSSYVSDVAINNPSPTQVARYQMAILDGNTLDWKAYSFNPNETRFFNNIVHNLFVRPQGAYALLVKGDDANPVPPVISATTYNNNQGDTTKGTFGVALPVVQTSSGLAVGSPAALSALPGLRDVPPQPDSPALLTALPNVSAAYTNIGFVNTGTDVATLEVRFKAATGDSVGSTIGSVFTKYVNPNQTVQFTKPLERIALFDVATNPVASEVMCVKVVSGNGVIPYASISDMGSSDPVFVSNRGVLSPVYRVPGVVRAAGKNGTFFKSRFVLYNPSTAVAPRIVRLTFSFRACDSTGICSPRLEASGTEDSTLRPGETKTWEDFVSDWLNPSDLTLNYVSSWVDVAPADSNPDPLVVRADTYNNQPTGNFGTQVQGFVAGVDGASPSGQSKRLVIPRVVQNGSYRTNLVLFPVSGSTASATVTFYSHDGRVLGGSLFYTLAGDNSFIQLNSTHSVWNGIPDAEKAAGVSVVIEAVDGVVGGYASQVDNVSGDSTLTVAQPSS